MSELAPDEVAAVLRERLHAVTDAQRAAAQGGLPEGPGLYAWWVSPGAIPGVAGPVHPREPFELLYVGIAPKDAKSTAMLRSRVRGQHLGGNIGSSTFRQSLAALLLEEQAWLTRWSGSRSQLIPEHNRALSDWQRSNLRLAWVELACPWRVEGRAIALMRPPLNLAGNASHPLHRRLTTLRAELRNRASIEQRPTAGLRSRDKESAATGDATSPERGTAFAEHRTQRVTAEDIATGQLRIPRGATKALFPPVRQDVTLEIRGLKATCRWDPRYGPPERSGVVRIGRAAAREFLRPGDVLNVRLRGQQLALG
jgi:hypothetical protein